MIVASNHLRILMAEDEPAHAEAIRRAFESGASDLDIQTVTTLADYRVAAVGRAPDIALLDLNLPDGRAVDALTAPSESGLFPVLIMTSFGNEQTAVEALKAGALDYVVKSPETFAAMPRIVERALREWGLLQERRRADEALRQNEANLAALIDNTDDLVWAVDTGYRLITGNAAFRQEMAATLGRACEPGESLFAEDLPRDVRLEWQAYYARALAGERFGVQVGRRLQSTPRTMDYRFSPIRVDGDVIGVVVAGRDVTDSRRAEEERLELERRLLHSQKLESLGVLAGGIAHDFNNLLTAILGNLDLALEDLSPVSGARPSINEAVVATRHAVDLTRQMLAYSGRGHFEVKELDLSELVAENVHMLRAAISKNITLKLQLGEKLPRVSADAGQMQQVVMNLITNASEAVGEAAGIVALATGVQDCDADYLTKSRLVEKPAAGTFVCLEVTDTGCGMDEETEQRLFDPFFTTKFTGRGLGMSAILGIVRGHGGAITVESGPGKGTTVRVLFPASTGAEDPPPAGGSLEAVASSAPATGGLVLVADDEESVLGFCERALKRLGFQTVSAANGEEAVAIFRERADEISWVLLDLTMPRMDGVAAFLELRRLRPDVPVIMCSGFDEEEATERLRDRGLTGFVKKPYGIDDLRRAAESLPRRRRPAEGTP
jgi:two-component system cell cycle sensor histidine kinase/response regulator CckA